MRFVLLFERRRWLGIPLGAEVSILLGVRLKFTKQRHIAFPILLDLRVGNDLQKSCVFDLLLSFKMDLMSDFSVRNIVPLQVFCVIDDLLNQLS